MYTKNEVNYIQDWCWCGLLGIVDKQWIVIPLLPEEQDCHARTEINVSVVVACLPFSAYHVVIYREGYIYSQEDFE